MARFQASLAGTSQGLPFASFPIMATSLTCSLAEPCPDPTVDVPASRTHGGFGSCTELVLVNSRSDTIAIAFRSRLDPIFACPSSGCDAVKSLSIVRGSVSTYVEGGGNITDDLWLPGWTWAPMLIRVWRIRSTIPPRSVCGYDQLLSQAQSVEGELDLICQFDELFPRLESNPSSVLGDRAPVHVKKVQLYVSHHVDAYGFILARSSFVDGINLPCEPAAT